MLKGESIKPHRGTASGEAGPIGRLSRDHQMLKGETTKPRRGTGSGEAGPIGPPSRDHQMLKGESQAPLGTGPLHGGGEGGGCGGEGVQPGTPRGPRRGVRQCIPTGMHGRAWGLLRYGPCNPWGIRVDLDCFLKIIPLLLAPGAGGTNGIRY